MKTKILILFAALALLASEVRGPSTSPSLYTLAEGASGGQKAVRNLPEDGLVELTFVRSTEQPPANAARFALELTPFTDEAHTAIKPTLKSGAALDSSSPLWKVQIQFPKSLPVGKYSGALLISGSDGQYVLCNLEVQRPLPAVLIAGQQTANINVTIPFLVPVRRFLGFEDNATTPDTYPHQHESAWRNFLGWEDFTTTYRIDLRSKNGSFSGLAAYRHEQPPKGPASDTDPKQRISIQFIPSQSSPTTAEVTLTNLRPGEYTYYLRFFGPGSEQDDLQKVTVTVHVRSSWSWVWALVFLSLGTIISWLLTKYLEYLRARAELLGQIEGLRPRWTPPMPNCLAVAWIDSVLEQACNESRVFSFTRISEFKARLEKVTRVVVLVDKLHELLAQARQLQKLHRYRVERRIFEVLTRIEPCRLSESVEAQIKTDIAALNEWFKEDKRLVTYKEDLRKSCEAFQVSCPDNQECAEAKKKIRDIQDALGKDQNEPSLNLLDAQYCQQKLLWQYRGWTTECSVLRGLLSQPGAVDMDNFFAVADLIAWTKLKEACDKGAASIHYAVSGHSGRPQTHEPISFTFSTHDQTLNDLFIVQHGCRYLWRFERKYRRRRAATNGAESDGPIKVEYPEGRGNLCVSVEIELKAKVARPTEDIADPEKTKPIKIPVGQVDYSEADTALNLTVRAEKISVLGGFFAAVISGLSTYYYSNPDFGSARDYLSLFLIAAGFDQGRKLLQSGQSSGSESNAGDATKPATQGTKTPEPPAKLKPQGATTTQSS